jgi:hypothetical protein
VRKLAILLSLETMTHVKRGEDRYLPIFPLSADIAVASSVLELLLQKSSPVQLMEGIEEL